MRGENAMFSNEQIAHDLAVARMAGKQLPADTLVKEYQSSYQTILDYLYEQPVQLAETKAIKRPF